MSKLIVFSLPGTRLLMNTLIGAAIRCACLDCGTYTKNAKMVTVWIHQETYNNTVPATGGNQPNINAIPLATCSAHVADVPSQICSISLPNKTESISVPMKISTSPANNVFFRRTILSIYRRNSSSEKDIIRRTRTDFHWYAYAFGLVW